MSHSAASTGRRIGGPRKLEKWSMSDFSKALSAKLREINPEFRALSDQVSARNARRAKV